MNTNISLGGIQGNVDNEINNIDLVMASNTQVTQDHNNIAMSYVLTVMTYN